MGMLESLGVDGLFSDVQRMDKRQVNSRKKKQFNNSMKIFILSVFLSSSQFRNDCLVCLNDLERINGSDWK